MKAFSSFHPAVSFVYFICVIVVTMLTMNPVFLIFSIIGALMLTAMLEGVLSAVKSLGFYIPTFILIALFNPLFSHNGATPLFFMNGNPVTMEAVLFGCAAGAMFVGIFYWCRCYNIIMTSDKFIYLFGRAIPRLSLVISMALRFVPSFKTRVKKIREAQKTLGIYASDSFADKIMSAMRVFYATITWALENAADTAASMNARGYGLPGRTSFSLFKFKKRDFFMIIIIAVLTVISLAGKTSFYFYPEVTPLPMDLSAKISYISMLVMSLIPFIIEAKEELRWKYLISKI